MTTQPTRYPTDFKRANDDGRVHYWVMNREDARALMDGVVEDGLMEMLDEAQGDAQSNGQPQYVILCVQGEE